MESNNRNNDVILKILDLEITRKQASYIFFFGLILGVFIGVVAATN